jgi:hypothetical protein
VTLTLRQRILLTLLPLLVLLAVLGGAGVVLLHRLGGRIDEILRENYDSVRYMQRLDKAVERIDSSFQFAIAGRPAWLGGPPEPVAADNQEPPPGGPAAMGMA